MIGVTLLLVLALLLPLGTMAPLSGGSDKLPGSSDIEAAGGVLEEDARLVDGKRAEGSSEGKAIRVSLLPALCGALLPLPEAAAGACLLLVPSAGPGGCCGIRGSGCGVRMELLNLCTG